MPTSNGSLNLRSFLTGLLAAPMALVGIKATTPYIGHHLIKRTKRKFYCKHVELREQGRPDWELAIVLYSTGYPLNEICKKARVPMGALRKALHRRAWKQQILEFCNKP